MRRVGTRRFRVVRVRSAPPYASRDPGERAHVAHLHEDHDALADAVNEYTGGALTSGASTIVLATTDHRFQFQARWRAAGLDLAVLGAHELHGALDGKKS